MYKKVRPNDPPRERDALVMSYNNCPDKGKNYFDLMNCDCSGVDEADFVSILFEFYATLKWTLNRIILQNVLWIQIHFQRKSLWKSSGLLPNGMRGSLYFMNNNKEAFAPFITGYNLIGVGNSKRSPLQLGNFLFS